MAAVPEDLTTPPQLRAVAAETASTEHGPQPSDLDVTCSEDGSHCLSTDDVRTISRRVVAEHQRLISLLAAYDSQQSEPSGMSH
ncbi:MAG: hypothetical protein KC442_07465 [Thermomicrobiales bacterium]|nr:hypothetical protein [Thermomicrobiales bacterium]